MCGTLRENIPYDEVTPAEAESQLRILKSDSARLLTIIQTIEVEARIYLDGYTDRDGKWDTREPWAECRWIRLKSAQEFLRKLAERKPTPNP